MPLTEELGRCKQNSIDFKSDCSTQVGDLEVLYPQALSRDYSTQESFQKKSNLPRSTKNKTTGKLKQVSEKQATQKKPRKKSDKTILIDEAEEEATVKRPKKLFRSERERKEFVRSYKMKYKTEMCKNWEITGKCKYQSTCSFAHGEHELQRKAHLPENYKTKICM